MNGSDLHHQLWYYLPNSFCYYEEQQESYKKMFPLDKLSRKLNQKLKQLIY